MPDLDEMLRDYASRWRAGLDETPVHETARPRRWPALLAAAAVVLVVVAASLLATTRQTSQPLPTGQPTPSGQPSPTPSSTQPADVVPWKPLPATHPTLPVRTVPARPVPGAAANLPACTAGQVRTSSGEDGAGGSMMRWIELRLVGDRPCRLAPGYPTVEPVFRGTGVQLPVMREHEHGYWPATAPVPLRKGHPATVQIWWQYAGYCAGPIDIESLRVTVPGLAPLTVTGFGKQSCADAARGTVPPLQVWPTAPQSYHPARTQSVWREVRASGDLKLTARPGSLVHFTVTLVSRHDLVLDPCPDYQVLLAGPGIAPQQPSYALNCAAVPYRNAAGKPMLPAGTPVTFGMQVRAPQQSATKFIWSLGPEMLGVATGGHITVAATGPLQAPTCTADDLRATTDGPGGAGGTEYLLVDLHLRGPNPCRLDGYPEVQPMSGGKQLQIPVKREPLTNWGWTGGTFLVRPGQPAVAQVAWPATHYCGPQLDVDHIGIVLPGDGTPLVVRGFGRTTCNPGEGHPPIEVSPLAPWNSLPHRQ